MNPHHAPRLRRAVATDAASCARLVRSLLPELRLQPPPEGLDRFLASIAPARQAQAIAEYRYRVAEDGSGRLVGLAALRAPRHLFHLFVAEHWQGRGLGLRLFRAVTEGEEHLPLTVNSSLAAVGFYTRLGLRPVRALQHADGIRFLPKQRP